MRETVRALTCALTSAALISAALVGTAAADTSTTASTVAPRAAVPADSLRVAAYNICKSTCGSGPFAWLHRRTALVREVRWADPDVLALQEATTRKWLGVRHIDDVRRLLAPAGYQAASLNFKGCPKGCSKGAHVFYKTAKLKVAKLPSDATVAAAGMTSLSAVGRTRFGSFQDRGVSWAFLTPRSSSRTTLYLSVHLTTQKTPAGERLRLAVAQNLRGFAERLISRSGLSRVPIVVAGDFNSFQRRQPNGAQTIMARTGFYDGFRAPVKANADIGTVNYAPKINKYRGFPPAPYRYKKNTTRIDYVFSTVAPKRHEVVVRLDSRGRFDNAFRASDHNMVMVDLPLR